jgi:hypothetical protein
MKIVLSFKPKPFKPISALSTNCDPPESTSHGLETDVLYRFIIEVFNNGISCKSLPQPSISVEKHFAGFDNMVFQKRRGRVQYHNVHRTDGEFRGSGVIGFFERVICPSPLFMVINQNRNIDVTLICFFAVYSAPKNIHDGNLVLALKIIDKMPNVAL